MSKKLSPSGYVTLTIDSTHVDDNNYLLEETEDEKLLYELFRNKKLQDKPILFCEKFLNILEFAMSCNNIQVLVTSWVNPDSYSSISFDYLTELDKIQVTLVES